jgi:hypothetical protein
VLKVEVYQREVAQVIDGTDNPLPSRISVGFGHFTLFHAHSFFTTVFHCPNITLD